MMNKGLLSAVQFLLVIGAPIAGAQEAGPVDAFIEQVRTVTYDCPNPEDSARLEQYLTTDNLTQSQEFALLVEKSHFLICDGKASDAQRLLFDITRRDDIDNQSYFYASAIYQIGFTYDLKEQPQRCEYYEQAQALAAEKHSDIYLSATLGLITNCRMDLSVGERLGMMFNVLERYSKTNNYQALAHIHNTIGLIYGDLQQHVLAAEQYLKAHEMGLKVYTGSNRLTILISAISSLLASGQYERALQAIKEFGRINRDVGTPLTNYFYYHALTGYYYRTGDIANLKVELPALERAVKPLSNPVYKAMVKWYQAVPCVYEQDEKCVADYLQLLESEHPSVRRHLDSNLDYLKLMVEMQMVLRDWEQAEKAFDKYASRSSANNKHSQSSASILGVANLYSKIYSLESEIERTRRIKRIIVGVSIAAFLLLTLIITYYLRKKHQAKLAIDPTTGLLNSDIAMSRIQRVHAPEEGKTNALALLDLSNFRELNMTVGLAKGNEVLRDISKTLQKVTRDTDILGRYGPEQFLLCLPNIEEQSAMRFFDRLQRKLDETHIRQAGNQTINVRSSMSIFIATERFSDMQSVLDELLLSINVKSEH